MNIDSAAIVLHLSLIDTIGPSTIARLISYYGQNLDQIYSASISDFRNIGGITQETAHKLVTGLADMEILHKELLLIERNAVPWMSILDPAYPELLKNIHLPPPILYWLGTLTDTSGRIAIVGSRKANDYGKQAVGHLVGPLVANDWTIVSGGALGADTMAHQATLDAGGTTIAVLGSGLLQLYPASNKQLFKTIIDSGGALISPFPLLMGPLQPNFPARNRVIAGMSRGCIVVQAAAKSGARITAEYCLQQGREVFAIPGPIDDPLSVGCHALIQQGAKLTTNANDILIEFGQEQIQQTIISAIPVISKSAVDETDFSPQGLIVRSCQKPSSVDELLELTGLPLLQMSNLLFELQLQGRICQNMAGLWERQ